MARLFPYALWAILALPAIPMLIEALTSDNSRILHRLLHPSGEFAARFLIIAMIATPLAMLLKGWRGPRWLVKNRRYFGVAAFGYALLHTVFYLVDEGVSEAIQELPRFYIWTGWLAFFIFIPLAVTSFDYAVRKMGPAWKSLQRWVYVAAILTFLHWAALHNWQAWPPALVHFSPLIALTAYRLWWHFIRQRPVGDVPG